MYKLIHFVTYLNMAVINYTPIKFFRNSFLKLIHLLCTRWSTSKYPINPFHEFASSKNLHADIHGLFASNSFLYWIFSYHYPASCSLSLYMTQKGQRDAKSGFPSRQRTGWNNVSQQSPGMTHGLRCCLTSLDPTVLYRGRDLFFQASQMSTQSSSRKLSESQNNASSLNSQISQRKKNTDLSSC